MDLFTMPHFKWHHCFNGQKRTSHITKAITLWHFRIWAINQFKIWFFLKVIRWHLQDSIYFISSPYLFFAKIIKYIYLHNVVDQYLHNFIILLLTACRCNIIWNRVFEKKSMIWNTPNSHTSDEHTYISFVLWIDKERAQ